MLKPILSPPWLDMYPFFAFADKRDPYNYQLTMFGSLAIWGSELISSFVARQICLHALHVDVTNLGLDEMRSYPELVSSVAWTSVHVLMDMLLFLIVRVVCQVVGFTFRIGLMRCTLVYRNWTSIERLPRPFRFPFPNSLWLAAMTQT